MTYKIRKLPTREALARVQQEENLNGDASGVDLVLNLLTTADLVRSHIYDTLNEEHNVSEGKFNLLMSLFAEGEIGMGELALRINVRPATVSVMVKRMLAEEAPLITTSPSEIDGRSHLIALSDIGRNLVKNALPDHCRRIEAFADVLSDTERNSLISMLQKLLRKN